MKCNTTLMLAALMSSASLAAERAIVVPATVQMSWEFVTPGTGARLRPHLGVGFWQRSSGAKPGVGANYVSALEYQLPEAAPARVRSASFQFSGRSSQCVGAEPVVIEVSAYGADEYRMLAIDAGCNEYVSTPFDPQELADLIESLIAAREPAKPDVFLTNG